MLECLQNLGNGQYEMDKWVFPVLRSSYDFLNEKLQRFFLYCVLSTNGKFKDGRVDHLIRRFVYENIDETKKFRVQCNEGYNMLYILKNHCMLEQDGWMINKFLGAMAIGIAEDTCEVMAKAYKNLTKIPSDDQWEGDLQKVFLTGNNIKTIPNGTCPRCSQLSTLLLDHNVKLNYISGDFFNNMPALKTLDLSETRIKRLPESASNLECLVALLLSQCRELSYIPSLRKLKRLISLDLSSTAITETPVGLESLFNLRYLNLLHTDKLLMSASLVSKLINLECLGLGSDKCSMDVMAQSIQGLEKLEVLVGYFRDISVFNTFVSMLDRNRVIRSCQLTLRGASDFSYSVDERGIFEKYSTKRITFMRMDLGNRKAVLPGDIKLVVDRCHQGTGARSLCGVLIYAHNNNPHLIENLNIFYCKDVEYLCCCMCPFCYSSQLVGRIRLVALKNLKNLVSSYAFPLPLSILFSHLTHLEIQCCDNMETQMTPELLAHLPNLRTIKVHVCWKMKEMVGVGGDHSEMEFTGSGDFMAVDDEPFHPAVTLPKLTSLKLDNMPQLVFVYRGIMFCPSLQEFSARRCNLLKRPQIAITKECVLRMEKTSIGYDWEINID